MPQPYDREPPSAGGPPGFVGRVVPLSLLDRWWADACAGHPRVVLVAGEAGIGKSRTIAHFLESAGAAGHLVASGVCHQGLGVPYLPLAGALGALAGAPGIDPRGAAALARLVDGDDLPGEQDGDPERRRLAMFVGVAEAVLAAAARPVVLAVDDVHWADPATLELLTHVLTTASHRAHAGPVHLLAVLAHRPVEPAERAARFLDRLDREDITRTLALTGFSEVETNALLSVLGPARPSRRLLAAVHEASRGNPLVSRSLWRRLTTTGAVRVEGHEMVAVDPTALLLGRVDATEAVRARVDGLDPEARDVLVDAVLLGGGCSADDVAAVRGTEPADLAPPLERLAAAGLLTDAGDGLRVDHPEVGVVAAASVTDDDRAERHARVVRVFGGAVPDRSGRDLLGLGRHAIAAGDALDPALGLAIAAPAAERAFAIGAWDTAARYFDLAVDCIDRGASPDEDALARLLHGGLMSHFRNHDAGAIHRVGGRLVDLTRETDDVDRWGEAVMTVARAELTLGTATVGHGADEAPLLELLARVGDERPLLRGKVLGELAELHFNAWDFDGGVRWAAEARDVLDQVGDADLGARVEFAQGLQHLGRLDLDDAASCFVRSRDYADGLVDPWLRAWGRGRLPAVLWSAGRLGEAAAAAADAMAVSEENHDWAELSLAAAFGAGVAATQGRFAPAERLAAMAVQNYHRSDYSFTPLVLYPTLAVARALRGNRGGAVAALAEWREAGDGGQGEAAATLCAALAGERIAAATVAAWPAVGPSEPNLLVVPLLAAQVEFGVATGRDDLVLDAGAALAELHGRGVRAVVGGCSSVARLLGVVAGTAGQVDEADRWFATAEVEAEGWESPSELARVRLDRATVRSAHAPDRADDARADLEQAAEAFDRLGMFPFLERAMRLLASLRPAAAGRAAASVAGPRRLRVLLVTDIVGSTRLNVAAGDERWHDLLAEHDRVVRAALRDHDGVEFKHTGDGVCAWFDSCGQAVACALSLQGALEEGNLVHPDLALRVRCGIAAGAPIPDGDDLFGLAVVRAVRVCAHAGAGEVLVGPEVPLLDSGGRVAFDDGVELDLKGLPGRHRVHRARWAGDLGTT